MTTLTATTEVAFWQQQVGERDPPSLDKIGFTDGVLSSQKDALP